ncbi:hypothetical protein [Glutamicibacter sp. BW77]|uniref:hypothetical protein n=1 Tax=Glutamicibacter sp. BW77 TaxID=2024402 RepID=UPI00197A9279|nr:hypothetical protein [Glutamicibacter sp. BW77]
MSERDVYAVTVPTVPSASLEVQTVEEAAYLARARVGEITGTDVEAVLVASVIELDDGD